VSSRYEPVQTRTLLEGRIFDVREGRFRHEDGGETERQWVEMSGAVGIVAHDGERIWLVRQPREATGETDLLELPAGRLDVEGEPPLDCAKRELAEEIGKAAASWEHLTTFYTSPGSSNERCHLFLATGLSDDPGKGIASERIDVEAHPLAALGELIAENRDSKTLIGLSLLRERLRNP
jgi:8-oxo-dGTP pyrophosphatase MutT (NUDIX family)